jgi:hypothetical protein
MLKRTDPQPTNQCVGPIESPWFNGQSQLQLDIFKHPNAQCTPETWDQRIPNEPLFDRNFIIERPPIISQDRPRNTSLCTPAGHVDRPWLLMNHATEKSAMLYWYRHTHTKRYQGVNSSELNKKSKSLKKMIKCYPDRPWLKSIARNVVQDSQLSFRDYYNPKDCINTEVNKDLTTFNRIADDALSKEMTNTKQRLNGSTRLWNQSTSMKMTEPVDFNYHAHVDKCYLSKAPVKNTKSK